MRWPIAGLLTSISIGVYSTVRSIGVFRNEASYFAPALVRTPSNRRARVCMRIMMSAGLDVTGIPRDLRGR